MLDTLLLLSGNDIPFAKARLTIHQPTIKEIAYIGEETFFLGCGLLNFSKDLLTDEDKNNLKDLSDFEILMSVLVDKQTKELQRNRICALLVLSLIFPTYHLRFDTQAKQLLFVPVSVETGELDEEADKGFLTEDNFNDFKEILSEMLCLSQDIDFNPQGAQAQKIAEKIKRGRQKRASQKNVSAVIHSSTLSLYMSVLAVGIGYSFEELNRYTLFQIYDEYERYIRKLNYDANMQARMAGAKNLKEVEDWMKDLHNSDKKGI